MIGIDDKAKEVLRKVMAVDGMGTDAAAEQIIAEALAFAIEHHEEFTVTECSIGSGGHRLLDGLLRARVGVTETVPGEVGRVGAALPSTDTDPILQFFVYAQLPPHLQEISAPFCELAHKLVEVLPLNEERYAALHRLLEAKDAAVRARIYK